VPDSAHEAVLDAVGAILPTLALDGMQLRLKRLWVLTETWLTALPQRPCLVYAPVGTEADLGGTNGRDDWGYPVTIRIVDTLDAAQTDERMGQILKWRKLIKAPFHHRRLAAVATHYDGVFLPGPLVEPEAAAYQTFVSPLQFQFRCRETRS
jgi:hypothetical protein